MLSVRTVFMAAAFGLASVPMALAAGARSILVPIQGTLSDLRGDLENGVFTMVFSIYRDASGGIPLWQEVVMDVPVRNGAFALYLGERVPIDAELLDPAGGTLYLAARVGNEPEMQRWPIGTVPQAASAERARVAADCARVGGKEASEFAPAGLSDAVRAMMDRVAELEARVAALDKDRRRGKGRPSAE
jgi:hypothetical protein